MITSNACKKIASNDFQYFFSTVSYTLRNVGITISDLNIKGLKYYGLNCIMYDTLPGFIKLLIATQVVRGNITKIATAVINDAKSVLSK